MFKEEEITKGFSLLGLNLSEIELKNLQSGKIISLETRNLSEIGSAFILATALFHKHSENPKKTLIFKDIFPSDLLSSINGGIPVYCWTTESFEQCCLYLTLLHGIPSVKIVSSFSSKQVEKAC